MIVHACVINIEILKDCVSKKKTDSLNKVLHMLQNEYQVIVEIIRFVLIKGHLYPVAPLASCDN
jgi:hypothetical protein